MPRTTRSPRIAEWWLTCVLAATVLATSAPASAQTADELAQARTLFSDALRDQDQKHFDIALEKFRRVAAVRDTAPVRYRIGSCLEGLGNLAQATAAYQAAVDAGQADRAQDDVVRASRTRIEALARRVPRVSISLSGRLPGDADVRIDDRRVPPEALKETIPLDPGEHVITATANGSKPFRTVVFLAEGGVAPVTIPLDPDPNAPPFVPTGRDTLESPVATVIRPSDAASTSAPTKGGSGQRTAGVVVVAGGGALVVSGVVVYILRASAVATLDDACPGGMCPAARRDELDATRSRALVYGPVAAGLGIAGVAALGVGSYLLLTAPTNDTSTTRSHARIVPVVGGNVAGLEISGAF